MVPPQDRPTFQAVSSATPNSSTRGLPLPITSIASVTTAPSTQPPETEPRKLPSSSSTRLEPTGGGAEPQVSTTVARATPRPALRQSSAAFRMSSSRASIRASIAHYNGLPTCKATQLPMKAGADAMSDSKAEKTIDPGVRIGHVHLKVADLDRALNFYIGVLGFELT